MGQKKVRQKLIGPKLHPLFLEILILYFTIIVAILLLKQKNKSITDWSPTIEYPFVYYRN